MNPLNRYQFIFDRLIPWLILVLLAIFTYEKFFLVPYAGFEFERGNVTGVYDADSGRSSLQVGDKIIRIGSTAWEEFDRDLRLTILDGTVAGQVIPILVERESQILSIEWRYPGVTETQILERLNSQWWLAYVFWLAGTAALLFVRPKDTTWLLLVAFNYLTAVWIAAGSGPAHWHIGESATVLRAAVWMCVPVYLHFHWVFPRPLGRLPAFAWIALYAAGGGMAIAEGFQLLGPIAFFWGFLLAIVGSISAMAAHFLLQPAFRRDLLLILLGGALVLVPPVIISVVFLLGKQPSIFVQGGSMLALPALPGAYFFAVYRRQIQKQERRARRLVNLYISAIGMGTILITIISLLFTWPGFQQSTLAIGIGLITLAGIIAVIGFFPFLSLPALAESSFMGTDRATPHTLRANRLVSTYLFIILLGTLFAIVISLLNNWLDFPGKSLLLGVAAALVGGVLALVSFAPFQRFIDRRLLDIPLPPTHLVETYSEKITTSLDTQRLIQVLRDEILPSLLIRQSALLRLDEEKPVTAVYTSGVSESMLPSEGELSAILTSSRDSRNPSQETKASLPRDWMRAVLPLEIGGKVIGAWLLGSRDPDDIYHQSEITVLRSIANQTAIALVNIAQSERLHTLYQVDIERQEEERARLARGLHDEVLNQLASLSMHTDADEIDPRFKESHALISTYLRGVISDLRPAMLTYGLYPALEELVDQLSRRTSNGTKLHLDVPPSEVRYDPKVEQHVYRVVQQACENALRHAHARSVCVRGALEPGQFHLVVEDDGIGFPKAGSLDMNKLLIEGHYGLVGMYERAALIGADLAVSSAPDQGTRVSVKYRPGNLAP